ncbi:C69 family dipeptidase [Brachybacterium sp. GPGPB12]|uniref:C69 family dipeptidase n=1 Tax=Brachybacterium sp. GPGPB12 TaxID=3023517 RepID=UPI0031345BA8
MRYTAIPNALPDEGIWGRAGINAADVAMSATETITSNPRVLAADPLVERDGETPGGFGEEDFVTLVVAVHPLGPRGRARGSALSSRSTAPTR